MTFNTLSIYVVFFTRMQRFSLDLLLRGGPSLSFYLITHNPSDLREREREVALESGSGLSTNVPPELIGSATERAQIKGPRRLFKELAEQCLTVKAAPQTAGDVISGLQRNPPLHK